mgnify:CR=1 FL=1
MKINNNKTIFESFIIYIYIIFIYLNYLLLIFFNLKQILIKEK